MSFNFPQLPIKNTLLRHLVWVGILKIILLYGIWFFFFRGNNVPVDDAAAAQHFLSPTTITTDEETQP